MSDEQHEWSHDELDQWYAENIAERVPAEYEEEVVRDVLGIYDEGDAASSLYEERATPSHDPEHNLLEQLFPTPCEDMALETKRQFRAKIEERRASVGSGDLEPIESTVPELTPVILGGQGLPDADTPTTAAPKWKPSAV